MQRTKPTRDQWLLIKQSANAAIGRIAAEKTGTANLERSLRRGCIELLKASTKIADIDWKAESLGSLLARLKKPQRRELEYQYLVGRALITLSMASQLRRTYPKPKRAYERVFGQPFVRRALREAIVRDDTRFFIKFGRALEKNQIDVPELVALITILERFLVGHWVVGEGDVPSLYNLSIKKLELVCKKNLGVENLTSAAIEKTRQRLGLLTFRSVSRQLQ